MRQRMILLWIAKLAMRPSTEDIKHVDKSVKLPVGAKSFEIWGRTLITMDKYAKNKWSFEELVAFSHVDKRAMTYTRWIIGKFASPPLTDAQNQAEDYAMALLLVHVVFNLPRLVIRERSSECHSGDRHTWISVSCWLAGSALGFPSLISTAIVKSYVNGYVD